ncbi:MAG: sulfur carrier protein ThiS [Candidatus Riflebacteria bacterium]|nr:sulfur carrier protein ThiS [Candidatus Riflebacteria bacterium]
MIKVNDKPFDYIEGMTVSDVIRKGNFQFPLLIVKIDEVYIPRDMYNSTKVTDGADVQIIHLVSGG